MADDVGPTRFPRVLSSMIHSKPNKFEVRYQPGVVQRILVVILVAPANWIPVFRDFYKSPI